MKLPEELVSLLSDPETPNSVLQDLLTDLEGKIDVAEVFIVVGCTGAYSGYQEWYVGAFLSKEKADELCERGNDWLKQHYGFGEINWGQIPREEWSQITEKRQALKGNNPYDPGFKIDLSYGSEYKVETVSLKG